MDTRIIKIAFAVGSLAYAIYLFSKGYWGSGTGMVLVTTLAVLASLQSLRLLMVFVYLRQQRLDEARKWLDRVRPEHLWKRRRAYYAFLKGSMLMEKNMNDAERWLKQALDWGLKQDHDKAAVKLNLAVVAQARRKTPQARALLAECKRLDRKGMLKKDIKMVEEAIQNPQQFRARAR